MSGDARRAKAPNIKSPLGRVLGLGSGHNGTDHWLAQRLTAVALVPLTLWFALSLLGLGNLDYYAVDAWLARPLNAILTLALVLCLVWHSSLGTQVVAEDYLHSPAVKVTVLVLLRLAHLALALAGAFAVVSISVGASL